eukprot:Pgem_evm1s9629
MKKYNNPQEVFVKAEDIYPTVTWGTSPEDVAPIHGKVPDPDLETNVHKKQKMIRSLEYQGLEPNTPMEGIKVDKVFIDHNVPTSDRSAYRVNKATEEYIHESDSLNQVSALKKNVADFVVPYYELGSKNQGIVHVVGPEQ